MTDVVGWAKAADALLVFMMALTRRAHGRGLRACGRGDGGSASRQECNAVTAFAHPTL
jgi:hypothetical protein